MAFTLGANIPAVGSRTHFGFGLESDYGVVVPRTTFLRAISVGLGRESEPIDSEAISGRSQFRSAKAQVEAGGTVSVEYLYEGMELLFYALAGSRESPAVGTAGAADAAWAHTFALAELLNKSLTLEKHADIETFIYGGSKVNSASWTIEPNSFITGDFEFFSREEDISGQTAAGGGVPSDPQYATSTPVFPPDNPLHFTDIVKAGIGTVGDDPAVFGTPFSQIRSLSFSINNGMDRRFFLGSQYTKNPLPTAKVEVTGTLEMEFQEHDAAPNNSKEFYRKFRNKEEVSLVVDFEGPVLSGVSPNATYSSIKGGSPTDVRRLFRVYFPRIQFLGSSPSIDTIGPIPITLEFKALAPTVQPAWFTALYPSLSLREFLLTYLNGTDPAIFTS